MRIGARVCVKCFTLYTMRTVIMSMMYFFRRPVFGVETRGARVIVPALFLLLLGTKLRARGGRACVRMLARVRVYGV